MKVKTLGSRSHLQLKTGRHQPSAWFIVGTNGTFASYHSCQKKYICSRKNTWHTSHTIMVLIRLFNIQKHQRCSSGIFWLCFPGLLKAQNTVTLRSLPTLMHFRLGEIKCTTDAASAPQCELFTSAPDVLCAFCLKLSPDEVPHHL